MRKTEKVLAETLSDLTRLLKKRNQNSGLLRKSEMRRALELARDAVKLFHSEFVVSNRSKGVTLDLLDLDLREIEEYFVSRESTVLKEAGVRNDVRHQLILRIQRHKLDVQLSNVERNRMLRNDLERVEEHIDGLLRELENSKKPLDSKALVQESWQKTCELVFGAALVGINAAYLSVEPVTSNLSMAFGGGILDTALSL
jgi:hypothetical protein